MYAFVHFENANYANTGGIFDNNICWKIQTKKCIGFL